MNLTISITEQEALLSALSVQIKSFERAAKAYELQGRKATADATRHELADLLKLRFRIQDADQKTPQSKP